MLDALAKSLLNAKLNAVQGKPVSVKLSIPVDGSVEQEKFMAVVAKLSSQEQHAGGILIEKMGGSAHAIDDFLQALVDLVGEKVVENALAEIQSQQLLSRRKGLSLPEIREQISRPIYEMQRAGKLGT